MGSFNLDTPGILRTCRQAAGMGSLCIKPFINAPHHLLLPGQALFHGDVVVLRPVLLGLLPHLFRLQELAGGCVCVCLSEVPEWASGVCVCVCGCVCVCV